MVGVHLLKCGAVVVTKTEEKNQFHHGRSDVCDGPVARSSSDVRAGSDVRCLGEFRAWDEQLGFEVEMAKMVKSGGFCDWKGWGKGEKLDPLKTKQIHGSKPTKSQHTNKSQKNGGYFCGGF